MTKKSNLSLFIFFIWIYYIISIKIYIVHSYLDLRKICTTIFNKYYKRTYLLVFGCIVRGRVNDNIK